MNPNEWVQRDETGRFARQRPTRGVYALVHVASNLAYIGSSGSLSERKAKHLKELRLGLHYNAGLQAAFDEFGEDAFEFRVIEAVDRREDLLSREQWWLDNRSSGGIVGLFNVDLVAGSRSGSRHSEASREKCRIGTRARMSDPAARAHLAALNRGKKASDETRRKMSEKQRGEANKSAKLSWDDVARVREMFDLGHSVSSVARHFGVSRSTVRRIRDRDGWMLT